MATAEMIRHGRRQGSLRSPSTTASGDRLRPGQVAVVDAMEWERIKGSLSSANRDAEKRQAQLDARRTLHEKSMATVKNWENTIEGQRLKKLQARKMREDKEEAERVKVDIEEAKYQAERRKEAIERAKTLLYYQTDRIKQFHGALLLSEVLRERDAQVEYRGRKEQRFKAVDDYYAKLQEEERERGTLADLKAAKDRAKARSKVAQYQIMQATERERARRREREEALNEQAELEKEVAEFQSQQRKLEEQHHQTRLVLRDQLDHVLCDKKATEARKMEQEWREEEERRVFTEAKKKMTCLRKEKEEEIFQEFQTHQHRMRAHLHHQMQQVKSDEDERIAKAVAEQDAKRELEECQKEEKFVERTREIFHHRQMMIAEREKKEREKRELDQELLKQRVVQDQKFHSQQFELHKKAAMDARELQNFRMSQTRELEMKEEAKRKDEQGKFDQNMTLLQVEEDQFQEYASKVIEEAKKRGAHVQPLRKAAKAGAGGGRGPVFTGKGGIRPSYQVMDSTVVELPSYQPKIPHPHPAGSTQKRMGFTW